MVELKEFKKYMRNYYNTVVDKEEGETFKTWFSDYMNALEEEGNVVKENGKTYIKD